MTVEELIALTPWILSILAALGSVYTWIKGQGARDADTASTLTGAALNLVNELQDEVKRLNTKIEGLQSHVDTQETENAKINAKYAILSKEFREVEIEQHRLQQELYKVEVERDNLIIRVASLTDEIKGLTEVNIYLQETIKGLQDNIRTLNNGSIL